MIGNLLNIFMEHDLYLISNDFFVINEKCIILTHAMYCWLLLQINIPVLLMTAFVLQGHICDILQMCCLLTKG